jgi:hypothetical protein
MLSTPINSFFFCRVNLPLYNTRSAEAARGRVDLSCVVSAASDFNSGASESADCDAESSDVDRGSKASALTQLSNTALSSLDMPFKCVRIIISNSATAFSRC